MAKHWFIVPSLDGPASGGTLYNRELLRELQSAELELCIVDTTTARNALQAGEKGVYWLDSLLLGHFAALARANRERRPLALIAHYLPSLVEQSDGATPENLSADESFTLAHCDAVLATSQFMARSLARLGLATQAKRLVVEPGCLSPGIAPEPSELDGVRGLMVANLTPGKGVAAFLSKLALELRPHDSFQLDIVGRLDFEPAYARLCQAVVAQHFELTRRVTFVGGLSPQQVVERLPLSNLLISASRMESFGMAIAEARTVGVPVAALARGNVPSLVPPSCGGMLADSDEALARACVALARDRSALHRALELARRHARPPRSFEAAARDFLLQLSTSGLARRT
jgi:glycosyltransferase involved in cell wall biosynthesis